MNQISNTITTRVKHSNCSTYQVSGIRYNHEQTEVDHIKLGKIDITLKLAGVTKTNPSPTRFRQYQYDYHLSSLPLLIRSIHERIEGVIC